MTQELVVFADTNSKVLPPFLFPSLRWYVATASYDGTVFIANKFDVNFKFQGNKIPLPGPNSLGVFSIPLQKASLSGNLSTLCFANDHKWRRELLNALQTVYGKTPFFEYYETDLTRVIQMDTSFFADFMQRSLMWIAACLQWEQQYLLTDAAATHPLPATIDFPPYNQAFDTRFGFVSEVSILDLLFSKGPEAGIYIENLQVKGSL